MGSLLLLAATVWSNLHACRLGYPITTKWYFDQDVKVVLGATFTKRMWGRCGSLQKGGDVVATSQLMLRRKCDSPQMGCAQRATHKYIRHEQAIIEWSRQVISIIACCHSVKLCALAVRGFLITTQVIYFLAFRMPNTWKWPKMNMYVDLNLARFQYIDGFGCYHFCLNRFGLELNIFFWTLSQISLQFWDYRLLQGRRLTVDCHQHVGRHLLQAQCCVAWANQRNSRTDYPQHNSNCDFTFHLVHSSIAATNSTLYVA